MFRILPCDALTVKAFLLRDGLDRETEGLPVNELREGSSQTDEHEGVFLDVVFSEEKDKEERSDEACAPEGSI